jgi:hypothetical protein
MDCNIKLESAEERKRKGAGRYQAIVGSIMYAALATQLTYQLQSPPCVDITSAAKTVRWYLKFTANFRLHFSGNGHDVISLDIRYPFDL